MRERTTGDAKSWLKSHSPRFLRRRFYQWQFQTELELIEGTHENCNRHPSIIHFSFNKAATQYVKSILRRCAIEQGMVPVVLHSYAFNSDFPYLDQLSAEEMAKYRHIFRKTGYLYSNFGDVVQGIPDLQQYKILLVVRDPRDILVSEYFSMAYSHPVPDEMGDKLDSFLKIRTRARQSTIDDYVISESDRIYGIFCRYQTLLLERYENTYLTSYERMVTEFEGWLTDLLRYCEFSLGSGLMQSLLEENERIRPKGERIHKHVRRGKPGDYREKLQPDTVRYLDEKLETVLVRYGYCNRF